MYYIKVGELYLSYFEFDDCNGCLQISFTTDITDSKKYNSDNICSLIIANLKTTLKLSDDSIDVAYIDKK